jgi:hypothetical protein
MIGPTDLLHEIFIAFPLEQWLRERFWILATLTMPVFWRTRLVSALHIFYCYCQSDKSRTETGTGGSCTVPKNFNICTKPYLSTDVSNLMPVSKYIGAIFWKTLASVTRVPLVLKLVWNYCFTNEFGSCITFDFQVHVIRRDPVCAENTVLAQSPHTFSPLK